MIRLLGITQAGIPLSTDAGDKSRKTDSGISILIMA